MSGDIRDERGNYHGKVGTTAEHRTVGDYRAWCHSCGQWCYPSSPCGEPQCCADLPADVTRERAARWLAAHDGRPDDWPGYGTVADELLAAIEQDT